MLSVVPRILPDCDGSVHKNLSKTVYHSRQVAGMMMNVLRSSTAESEQTMVDDSRRDYDALIRPIESQMIRSVCRITRNREDAE